MAVGYVRDGDLAGEEAISVCGGAWAKLRSH